MIDNTSNASVDFAMASDCFLSGDLQKAAQICNQLLAAEPGHFDAMHLLGGISLRMGNPYRAAELIRESIHIRPSSAVAYMNLGRALYYQGKLEDAVIWYRKAIKLQHDLSVARQLLESTRNEIKQLDEAVLALEKYAQPPSINFTHEERERRQLHPSTINMAIRFYKHFGYIIIEDLFPEQYIDNLRDYFQSEYSQYFADTRFDDALIVGNKRIMVTVKLQGPFNNPEYYANPLIMPLMARLLGRDFILFSLGGVVSLPGAQTQRTHRDHRSLFEEEAVDQVIPSFAVTLGIPLIEMNDVNGTTRVYGKTHRNQDELSDKDRKNGLNPIIRKGSCMLFDYRLLHGGTPNKSSNVRPLMYSIYSRPWFRDCTNYSKQVPLSITDAEFMKVPEKHRQLLLWACGA